MPFGNAETERAEWSQPQREPNSAPPVVNLSFEALDSRQAALSKRSAGTSETFRGKRPNYDNSGRSAKTSARQGAASSVSFAQHGVDEARVRELMNKDKCKCKVGDCWKKQNFGVMMRFLQEFYKLDKPEQDMMV